MAYRIEFDARAEKELASLAPPVRERIVRALWRLETNPRRAANVKALAGGGYRLRVGDYRVLYVIRDDMLLVLVVGIGHRREIYRRGRPGR